MWFIIGIVILILIIPILIDIIILVIYGIGLFLGGILETLKEFLNLVGKILLTIILPTLETIDYAFTKDKSKWNEIIEKRRKNKRLLLSLCQTQLIFTLALSGIILFRSSSNFNNYFGAYSSSYSLYSTNPR